METLLLELPADIVKVAQLDIGDLSKEVAKLLALELFRENKISLGRAAELCQTPLAVFMDFAALHEVSPLRYGAEELEEDRIALVNWVCEDPLECFHCRFRKPTTSRRVSRRESCITGLPPDLLMVQSPLEMEPNFPYNLGNRKNRRVENAAVVFGRAANTHAQIQQAPESPASEMRRFAIFDQMSRSPNSFKTALTRPPRMSDAQSKFFATIDPHNMILSNRSSSYFNNALATIYEPKLWAITDGTSPHKR